MQDSYLPFEVMHSNAFSMEAVSSHSILSRATQFDVQKFACVHTPQDHGVHKKTIATELALISTLYRYLNFAQSHNFLTSSIYQQPSEIL